MITQQIASFSNTVLFIGFFTLILPMLFILFYKAHEYGFTSIFKKNKSRGYR